MDLLIDAPEHPALLFLVFFCFGPTDRCTKTPSTFVACMCVRDRSVCVVFVTALCVVLQVAKAKETYECDKRDVLI